MDVTVSLDDELAHFVEGQIAVGLFHSTGDLMREALRRMRAAEREADDLPRLRRAWQDGMASDDVGELDFTALKIEARARRAASGS